MSFKREWSIIINKLMDNSVELCTVPKIKKQPVWFSVSTDGDHIFINNANNHKPSSNLSKERILTYQNFEQVYPFYLKREKGEPVSKEVSSITLNQVYYFSLIKHLAH